MGVNGEDKQLSLAIGKKGQNVRLAAKLTGWRIDIKSEEEKRREVEAQFGELETQPGDESSDSGDASADVPAWAGSQEGEAVDTAAEGAAGEKAAAEADARGDAAETEAEAEGDETDARVAAD